MNPKRYAKQQRARRERVASEGRRPQLQDPCPRTSWKDHCAACGVLTDLKVPGTDLGACAFHGGQETEHDYAQRLLREHGISR